MRIWFRVAFAVLTALSKASPPLPQRTCRRFAKSAAKRDPKSAMPLQIAEILAMGAFDREFCFGSRGTRLRLIPAIRAYLFQLSSGIDPRKPEPGFHPYVFAQATATEADSDIDPYVTFLRQGRPSGPWCSRVIEGGQSDVSPSPVPECRTALHIHAYYIDQLSDIMSRLALNKTCPDIFLSTRNESDAASALAVLKRHEAKIADIAVFPNRGRDIGPMLTGFGTRLLDGYDFIGHIHTKGSLFTEDTKWVQDWVNFALSNTIGGPESGPMADQIINAMSADPKIGIAYPADPHIPGWGVNKEAAIEIAHKFNDMALPEAFNFPIGTMFWMRSEALRPFMELDLNWDDYPKEPIPNDGTMLHALERLFGAVPEHLGWEALLTHTPGVLR